MGKCWCGNSHPRGDARNGPVKHYTINLKLYQLRQKDAEEQEDGAHPGEVHECEAGVVPIEVEGG